MVSDGKIATIEKVCISGLMQHLQKYENYSYTCLKKLKP